MKDSAAILVIDDDPATLALLNQVLTMAGYQVCLADSGELGLSDVAAHPPDLILLDFKLTGIDGFEVCRRLKASAQTRDIPVILVSGTGEPDVVVEGLHVGAADYVTKPFQAEELLARVRLHLTLRQTMISLEQQAVALNQANEQLRSEIVNRQHLEKELRGNLDRAERSRRTLLSTLEDQTRAETALRDSEERFRRAAREWQTTFDATNDAIWVLDEDQRVLRSNSTAERIFHRPCTEMIGRHCWEIVHGTAEPFPECPAILARQSGHRETMQLQEGERWLEIYVDPIVDATGRYAGAVHIVSDITERKRVDETVQRSEEKYRDLVENINDVIFTMDADGIVTYVSSAVRQLAGFAPDDLVGHPFGVFVHPDDLPELLRRFSELREGRLEPLDFRYHTKDGQLRWARSSSRPILDGERLAGIRGLLTDITDRKRAEFSMRDSEERFRKIFEEGPLGMAMQSVSDGSFIQVNDAFCRMLGRAEEELTHLSFVDVTHPDHRARDVEAVKRLWEGRIPVYRTEKLYLKKDGETFWGSLTATVVRDMDGKPLYSLAMVEDITDRKRAEVEHSKLEAQLRQAQKMESVGRLAGGVAHDFNNMLSVILGHAELALEQVDPAQPLHAAIEEIQKAATRSADLTRQLLAFARKQTIAPRVLCLNESVAAALSMLRRLIGEDIDIEWRPAMDLWPIMVDPSQIDQILANLCVNSRDAIAGVGKVTIETGHCAFTEEYCATHPGFTPGDHVLLAVSDSGCGMDQDVQSHLFEPFFTTKAVGQGTGLGLATVYGIVKQNNGSIEINSEPDHGTTFRIYLPRYVGPVGQGRTEGAATPASRGHETILLVEDETAILALATRVLTRQGYTVLAAGTPGEAIRLAKEHTGAINLLVTDVVLPEMNGRMLAQKLLSLHPHLKRLFMSGYTANAIANRGVLDDNVHFIQKPFSIEGLFATVREALDSERVDGT